MGFIDRGQSISEVHTAMEYDGNVSASEDSEVDDWSNDVALQQAMADLDATKDAQPALSAFAIENFLRDGQLPCSSLDNILADLQTRAAHADCEAQMVASPKAGFSCNFLAAVARGPVPSFPARKSRCRLPESTTGPALKFDRRKDPDIEMIIGYLPEKHQQQVEQARSESFAKHSSRGKPTKVQSARAKRNDLISNLILSAR